MKDKMRRALGFLGLIEDEYGEYTPTGATRPFTDQPALDEDPEWSRPAPSGARTFPTTNSTSVSRVSSNPGGSLARTTPISVLEPSAQAPRLRPMPSGVRSVSPFSQDRDVAIFAPTNYNESRRITDLLRSNRAVVLLVGDVDAGIARRLVDFASGTAYALNAKMEILEKGSVYLISPQGTHVSPEARERLRATNYQSTGS
ncbi:MAG TPA: cell division protein SepF [Acidimicrobiales bacterium]